MTYEEKKFDLPELKDISQKQVDVHLGLYGGYVKHVNLLREQLHELKEVDSEKFVYAEAETRRRLGFEFNGMRMHEYYFEQWEKEAKESNPDSPLATALSEKYGSFEAGLEHFKMVGGGTRGIGWTILYFDQRGNPEGKSTPNGAGTPHITWVGDHELGQLAGLPVILAMDMWEHAYMVDYTPAEKKQYIEAFFKNLNWGVIEERFKNAK